MAGRRSRAVWAAVAIVALLLVAMAEVAQAAVTVSRAEVSGTRLRIEGRAAVPH